jgi:hypothetical protein
MTHEHSPVIKAADIRDRARSRCCSPLMLLSPLGEGLGEGVVQETVSALTPSPNLSPKGERNMTKQAAGPWPA